MKKFLIIILLFIAFAFRIFLSVNSKHGDMYNNWDWGQGMWKYGPAQVYNISQKVWPHSWPNQPPGSLYLHAFSYKFYEIVKRPTDYLNTTLSYFPSQFVWWWEISGPLIGIKIPSIFADFVIFWTLVQFGLFFGHPKKGMLVGFIYLFNPALWYNSGFWGQTDSIVAALSMLSILFLLKKRLVLSPLFLGLSLITKASWAPLVPLYLLYWWKYYRVSWPKLFIAPLTFYLLALPFHPLIDFPVWFTKLYMTRIISGESSWITVVAFNFWNLFFPNTYTPVNTPIFGVSAFIIAWIITGSLLIYILYRLLKKTTPQTLLYAAMLVFFTMFLFAPKMLQRYLYPAFPLLSSVLIFSKAKILWFIYGIISFCYLINMYYQWWAPGNPAWQALFTLEFMHMISIIYLAVFTFLYVKKSY